MFELKKYFFFVFFFTLCRFTFSQVCNISLEIKNVNNKRLSFTTYNSLLQNKYFEADSNGVIKNTFECRDTITFSYIGYYSKQYTISDLIKLNEVVLLEKKYDLPEVIVGKKKTIFLGKIKTKQHRSFSGESFSERFEMVKLIEIPKNITKYRIKKVFIKQANFNLNTPIRFHIYSINTLYKLPKDELLNQQIILNWSMYQSGFVTINLETQNIILETQPFFIGVQWLATTALKKSGEDFGIAETTSISDTLTFRKGSILDKNWFIEFENSYYIPNQHNTKAKELKFGRKSGGKNSNPINMIAYAEIELID